MFPLVSDESVEDVPVRAFSVAEDVALFGAGGLLSGWARDRFPSTADEELVSAGQFFLEMVRNPLLLIPS